MSTDTTPDDSIVLDPSGIGEAVKHGLSPWFIKMRFQDDSALSERNWKEANSPLSALPARTGNKFEQDVYDCLTPNASEVIDSWRDYEDQEKNNRKIRDAIERVADSETDDPVMLLQAQLAGNIETFRMAGDADLIGIWNTDPVHIRIFDIKSSWEESTYHQIQVAIYGILLDQILDTADFDVDYELSGGVIYRETDLDSTAVDALPQFDIAPRQDDVHRTLNDEGPFQYAFDTDFEDLPLPVDGGQTSPYAEVYNTKAVENNDISLLGLTSGEQRILKRNDLHTLEDVAELIEPPDDPRPYRFTDPDVRREHRDTVRHLEEQRGLNTRAEILAQRAQSLLGELNPDHPDAHDKPWTPWLQAVGSTALPEDDPPYDADDMSIQRGSLIRVYLNVQYDYARDQVDVLGARLDCSNYDGKPLSFAHTIDDIPDDYTDRTPEEALLTEFTDDLFGAIDALAILSNQPESAPIHFYLYTEQERTALVDSLKRHSDIDSVHALRDLFGMRAGIDQQMVSIVQPEVESRLALKQPATGLFPIAEAIYPNDDDHAKLTNEDWTYERESGETINLRNAFRHQLFDYSRPYTREDDTVRFLDSGDDDSPDGFYPILPRQDAQIPLEYIWACEDIDRFGPDWTDDARHKALIERYCWVDSNEKETRITAEDIKALSERAAHAVHHIERGLTYRDADIEKEPLSLGTIDSYTLGDGSLARACREYLDLEHKQTVTDALSQYRLPVKRRILSGRAAPIRVRTTENHGYMLEIKCDLIYDAFTFENPEQIAKSSRIGGSDGSSGGSYKVATPLELSPSGYTDSVSNPDSMLNSTPVIVDEFDPNEGTATLLAIRQSNGDSRYSHWAKPWTDNEDDNRGQYFGPGTEFILDENPNDGNADKSTVALKHATENELYNLMTEFRHETAVEAPRTAGSLGDIDEYMKWVKNNCDPTPNTKQREFITEVDHKISLLQGPPGTGKTSGALAHALLGRAYASAINGEPLRAAVMGASNKSVDEVMDDVAEMLDDHDDDGPLGETALVRLVINEPDEEDQHDNVWYVNYNERDDPVMLSLMDIMQKRLENDTDAGRQSGLEEYADEESIPKNIIVFGTPARIQKTIANFNRSVDIDDRYANGERFFDVIAADEASMLPLWQLFMVSAFWDSGGQVLLTGDQRQMPPVQSHEWEDENRRIIDEYVPYLSSLNYFRFLRGETVRRISDRDIESPEVTIPMTRLERTYRCHEDVSEFLREWVYAQDGIEYKSDQTETISDPDDSIPTGLGAALDPDEPISLLLHNDMSSQQSNFAEANLVKHIIENTPENESIGVVVPHNAQKGLVSAMCETHADVDTVERFQGGQKDVIILSATVSDPDFLQQESDFILNPNRLNVALSRMKKKLIVVAPKTLFQLLPKDVDEYDDSIIWKGLYSDVDANGQPRWSDTIPEFANIDLDGPAADVTVDVYDKRNE